MARVKDEMKNKIGADSPGRFAAIKNRIIVQMKI